MRIKRIIYSFDLLFQKNLFKKDSSFSFYDREKSLSSINILFYERGRWGLSASVAHAPLIPLPSLKLSPSPPTTLLKVGGLMAMDFSLKNQKSFRFLENPFEVLRIRKSREKRF